MLTSFGGYGLNNPTIVAFGACPSCTPVGTNKADYSLAMTFAYNPGFTFSGLSKLFYAAFNASAFQVQYSLCLSPLLALHAVSNAGHDLLSLILWTSWERF